MLKQILLTALKDSGRPLHWYQFAVKTKTGSYRFLANKEAQWQALNRITQTAKKKLPQYTQGQIVDALAVLVNRF